MSTITESKEVSQKELAIMLGTSQVTVSRWEVGIIAKMGPYYHNKMQDLMDDTRRADSSSNPGNLLGLWVDNTSARVYKVLGTVYNAHDMKVMVLYREYAEADDRLVPHPRTFVMPISTWVEERRPSRTARITATATR